MSFFTSAGIIVLATLIGASLQLTPGIFLIFYHYAIGKNSKKKANNLALSYIFGVLLYSIVMFLLLYAVYFSFFYTHPHLEKGLFMWIMAGVFFALSIAAIFFYYRKGKGTELFVSRGISQKIFIRARNIETKKEAFMLGLFSGTAELLFTFPVYIIAVSAANNIDSISKIFFAMVFVLSSTVPILTYFVMYRSGANLANIERRRVKNKNFIRFMLALAYVLLAVAILNAEFIK